MTRREFVGAGLAVPLAGQVNPQSAVSNEFLELGLHRDSGEGFVAVKGTGERWVWNWKETVAAPAQEVPQMELGWPEELNARLRRVTPQSIDVLQDGFALSYQESWGRFRCTVRLSGRDAVFQVEPDLRYPCQLGAIRFPFALRPEKGSAVFLETRNAGRLLRKGAESFTMPADFFFMRFFGALGGRSAYLSILEPGFDAALRYSESDYGWIHMPSLGAINTNRAQRFRFLTQPSHVAVARAYRQYAIANGMYRSLREKLEITPSLEKMFGAVLLQIGYLHDPEADYAGAFRALKARGVEKAYVYPVNHFTFNGRREVYPGYRKDFLWVELDQATLKELDRLGYLYTPWMWVNEIVDGSPFLHRDLTVRRQDGSPSRNWRVGQIWWRPTHEGRVVEMLKQAAPELVRRYPAFHFDVINAAPCLENFGGPWTYTREQDSQYRAAMMGMFAARDRVVGCEQNRDWALRSKHFGTHKLDGPYGQDARFWPAPLWQLAFHDSVMTSWWDHSTYNDPDLGHEMTGKSIRHRALLDILTADLPSVCPVGKMVGWNNPGGEDREMFSFRYDPRDPVTIRAVDAAAEAARFQAKHAMDDLISHEFLSEDGREQRTEYASGTKVRVRLPKPGDPGDAGELAIS